MSAGTLDHKLLEPLTDEQQLVINEVCKVFFDNNATWPTFQYVQAVLDHNDLDLRTVISTFPLIGGQYTRYSALAGLPGLVSANESAEIGLTILGLWHCSLGEKPTRLLVDLVPQVLQLFIEYRTSWTPNPITVQHCQIDSDVILQKLVARRSSPSQWMQSENFARTLFQIMKNEPPLSTGYSAKTDAFQEWSWNVDRSVLRYRDVWTINDYLARIETVYATPHPMQHRVLTSPLDIPTSLGYLNTAWRLFHERRPLLNLSSPERIASLAFEVATREEFYDRVSAFCDVIKSFIVPKGGAQHGGHALEKLGPYLESILPAESHQRAMEAIEALGHIRTIRNGGEHGDVQDKAMASFRELGIALPVADWSSAWTIIRGRVIVAFDNLREELLGLVDSGND